MVLKEKNEGKFDLWLQVEFTFIFFLYQQLIILPPLLFCPFWLIRKADLN